MRRRQFGADAAMPRVRRRLNNAYVNARWMAGNMSTVFYARQIFNARTLLKVY